LLGADPSFFDHHDRQASLRHVVGGKDTDDAAPDDDHIRTGRHLARGLDGAQRLLHGRAGHGGCADLDGSGHGRVHAINGRYCAVRGDAELQRVGSDSCSCGVAPENDLLVAPARKATPALGV
jgi:hypothetical protein